MNITQTLLMESDVNISDDLSALGGLKKNYDGASVHFGT